MCSALNSSAKFWSRVLLMQKPNGGIKEEGILHKVMPKTGSSAAKTRTCCRLLHWCVWRHDKQRNLCLHFSFYCLTKPSAFRRWQREMAGEVRSRLAGGKRQQPSSLTGIDRPYMSREMRQISAPLDLMKSLRQNHKKGKGSHSESVCEIHWSVMGSLSVWNDAFCFFTDTFAAVLAEVYQLQKWQP